jgi:hypothetical protein
VELEFGSRRVDKRAALRALEMVHETLRGDLEEDQTLGLEPKGRRPS